MYLKDRLKSSLCGAHGCSVGARVIKADCLLPSLSISALQIGSPTEPGSHGWGWPVSRMVSLSSQYPGIDACITSTVLTEISPQPSSPAQWDTKRQDLRIPGISALS